MPVGVDSTLRCAPFARERSCRLRKNVRLSVRWGFRRVKINLRCARVTFKESFLSDTQKGTEKRILKCSW